MRCTSEARRTLSANVGAKHLEAGFCRKAKPFSQMLRPYLIFAPRYPAFRASTFTLAAWMPSRSSTA